MTAFENVPLFDVTPTPAAPAATPVDMTLSAGRRRTLRQAADLAAGVHPMTKAPLHPEAARADDRKAPGLRCRDCLHLVGGGEGGWLKCDLVPMTRGPGTDARGWWPACSRFNEDTPREVTPYGQARQSVRPAVRPLHGRREP